MLYLLISETVIICHWKIQYYMIMLVILLVKHKEIIGNKILHLNLNLCIILSITLDVQKIKQI